MNNARMIRSDCYNSPTQSIQSSPGLFNFFLNFHIHRRQTGFEALNERRFGFPVVEVRYCFLRFSLVLHGLRFNERRIGVTDCMFCTTDGWRIKAFSRRKYWPVSCTQPDITGHINRHLPFCCLALLTPPTEIERDTPSECSIRIYLATGMNN